MLASAGNCVKLWNVGDHNELSVTSQLNENATELSFSCDGNYLASVSKNYSEIFLHAMSGCSGAKVIINKFIDNPKCVQFTNSSTRFLGTCSSKNLIIWDMKGSNIKKDFKIPVKADLCKISFSSSDSHTVAGTKKGTLFLLSNSNNSISDPIKIFDEETQLTDLQYSRHNLFLLGACCQRGNVVLVDAKVGKVRKYFRHAHEAPVSSLMFSPLNELLLSSVGYDKKLVFYNLNVKNVISTHVKQDPLTSAAFHPNGKYIVLGTITGNMELLDLRMLSEPVSVVKAYEGSVTDIKFQPVVKSKTKKKPDHSQPSRNVEIIVPNIKENVSPDHVTQGSKAGNKCLDLFSPIRNVQAPLSSCRSATNINRIGSTHPNMIENFTDLLSPPKVATLSSVKSKINTDQNYSFEGTLLSPARNKESTPKKDFSNISIVELTKKNEYTDRIENLDSGPANEKENVELTSIRDSVIANNISVTSKHTENTLSGTTIKSLEPYQREDKINRSRNVRRMLDTVSVPPVFPGIEKEDSIKNIANALPTLEGTNTCCSANLSIIQNYIKSEFENHEMKTNQRLMDLHLVIYKQFYSLKNEMMHMMEEHNSIYADLMKENIELKEEIERIRSNY